MHTPTSYNDLAQMGQYALRQRTYKGLHCGPAPLGYRRVFTEDRVMNIEPDPETAPLIRQIFKLQREGTSVRAILRQITELGLRSKNGNPLSVSALQHILTSPTYRGIVRTPDGSFRYARHDRLDQ